MWGMIRGAHCHCWLAVLLLNLLPVQPGTGFVPAALNPQKRWTPAAQDLSKALCARGPAPIFPEDEWRRSAEAHRQRVLTLLEDGFAPEEKVPHRFMATQKRDGFRKLNERHAVFNFLHEYYNIRGAKGTRRIGRWSPGVPVFTLQGATAQDLENGTLSPVGCTVHGRGITYDARTHFENASDGVATSFMWYHALLSATSQAEPVLHCYNLHEWAMQYWPAGAAAPPSQKYQLETMPLRVSQETINAVVEEKGIRCTHVDALRFFAPAAGPLNRHGASLEREAQLGLEQPGCVHAHMDLLKISLRLSPWVPAELLADCLELALAARRWVSTSCVYVGVCVFVCVVKVIHLEQHLRDGERRSWRCVQLPVRGSEALAGNLSRTGH